MRLYPLSFEPILMQKIWGGTRLNKLKVLDSLIEQLGESWEISVVDNNVSEVKNGTYTGLSLLQLIDQFPVELLGKKVIDTFGMQFPLLIKYIDAAQDLSIQVHPDDRVAMQKHNSFGKTEMWYVMNADPSARLILGFKSDCDKDAFAKAIQQNTVLELLNEIEVDTGDAFFIKPGLVHAIGAGITLAEIQQSSDITYRVYDYDRKDSDGNTRELHIEDSIEVSDYQQVDGHLIEYNRQQYGLQNLAANIYFTTDFLKIKGCKRIEVSKYNSFMVLMNVGERCDVICDGFTQEFNHAQTLLIPAAVPYVVVKGNPEANLLAIHL